MVAKKQNIVSRSSTEAEYRSLAQTAAELYWIRQLLCDLHIFFPNPPILWCDNSSALALARNPIFHARSKHIEIDYHFVREKVVRGDLQVQHISSSSQLVDLFTKPLSTTLFQQLSVKLLKSSSSV
ncbi:MAG: Ty1/Copia family ribonuclease HI [Sweet potato little leaf phytoplasma]|nr:Ty1/Copia family ribonuclease HI [Sweet potato little leaf phytoplasma]